MSEIYQPTGKAGEYCKNAVNIYSGCSHGCRYCYVPNVTETGREQFREIRPTKDTVKTVERQAHLYRGQEVFLCFHTDPYNSLDVELMLTRQILDIFRREGVIPRILTKAGMKSVRDFDLLDNESWYGATLTFIDSADSLREEPNAALPEERFAALREARARGIGTWASLEPVIDPEQTIEIIHKTHRFIDHYKVGKLNYDPREELIDWTQFLSDVTAVLERYGCDYYIKNALKDAAAR